MADLSKCRCPRCGGATRRPPVAGGSRWLGWCRRCHDFVFWEWADAPAPARHDNAIAARHAAADVEGFFASEAARKEWLDNSEMEAAFFGTVARLPTWQEYYRICYGAIRANKPQGYAWRCAMEDSDLPPGVGV